MNVTKAGGYHFSKKDIEVLKKYRATKRNWPSDKPFYNLREFIEHKLCVVLTWKQARDLRRKALNF